jgi:hypothetical protein
MGIARGKIMRSALALGLTIGAGTVAGTATEMVTPNPTVASADNGGYPDWNKPCVAENNYGKTEGIGNWCNDYQWGDSPSQQNSPRGYGYRNCTDFVA